MKDVIISVFSSVVIVGFFWTFFKDTLIESVGKSISYKFDRKLQDNQKLIDVELKTIEARLQLNGVQVDSLVSNNLLTLDFRREKQVQAIEVLWNDMMQLRKSIPGFVFTLESMPPEFHEQIIQSMNLVDSLKNFSVEAFINLSNQSEAKVARLFSGELLYSYYGLYQSVITMCLMNVSVEGLNGGFSNWYDKYNIMTIFSNTNINFDEIEGELSRTQKILDLIEKNFLADAEKIADGEVQMLKSNERAKQINEMSSQLNRSTQNLM